METVALLSEIEGAPRNTVKGYRKLFKTKYGSIGVQAFGNQHVAFQGGKTERLSELKAELPKVIAALTPFEVSVDGFGKFGNEVIYLRVAKSRELARVNRVINRVLTKYCVSTFELYTPTN
jgi:2'-5' RNA ligase